MKTSFKIIIAALVLVVLGIAYWLISPLFIMKQVSEKAADIVPSQTSVAPVVVGTGTFSGLQGHSAQGTAKLIKVCEEYFVRFEDDFSVTNGPDLFVYFGKDGRYQAAAQISALKGNVGGQNYKVPGGINPKDYNEVWVWCRAFSVAFGKAELR